MSKFWRWECSEKVITKLKEQLKTPGKSRRKSSDSTKERSQVEKGEVPARRVADDAPWVTRGKFFGFKRRSWFRALGVNYASDYKTWQEYYIVLRNQHKEKMRRRGTS